MLFIGCCLWAVDIDAACRGRPKSPGTDAVIWFISDSFDLFVVVVHQRWRIYRATAFGKFLLCYSYDLCTRVGRLHAWRDAADACGCNESVVSNSNGHQFEAEQWSISIDFSIYRKGKVQKKKQYNWCVVKVGEIRSDWSSCCWIRHALPIRLAC